MRYLTQELERMPFLLQRIFLGVGGAVDLKFRCLHFHALSFALGGDEFTLYVNRSPGGDGFQVVVGKPREVEDDLKVLYRGTVVESHELDVLVATAGSHPSFYVHFPACELVRLTEDCGNRSCLYGFHCFVSWIM